jgi:hypothetical protein
LCFSSSKLYSQIQYSTFYIQSLGFRIWPNQNMPKISFKSQQIIHTSRCLGNFACAMNAKEKGMMMKKADTSKRLLGLSPLRCIQSIDLHHRISCTNNRSLRKTHFASTCTLTGMPLAIFSFPRSSSFIANNYRTFSLSFFLWQFHYFALHSVLFV